MKSLRRPTLLWGRNRFFAWSIVFSCTVGVAASSGPIVLSSAGVLMEALHKEFGWNRGQVSFSVTLYTLITALMMPSLGHLIDRVGVRRIVVPAIVVSGAALCLVATSMRLWQFYLAVVVFSLVGSTTTSLPYVRVISMWFDHRRGLMLGIVASGIGLGFGIVPIVMQGLLQHFGWRSAYYGMAGVLAILIFPIQLLLLRDSPTELGLQPDNRQLASVRSEELPIAGDAFSAAIKTLQFWLLVLITFVFAFVFNGMTVHLVPMLKDNGISPSSAVFMASMMGFSLVAARILIGALLDSVFAPRLAIATFMIGSIGLALIAVSGSKIANLVGAALIGVGIGAETDIVSYMASRYFGMRSFGKIYGAIFGFFYLGTGLGPLALGVAYDRQGGYTAILIAYTVLCIVVTLTFAFFGPYKFDKAT